MGSIRRHDPTGHLFVDFRYRGVRCREYTALDDTLANRRQLDKLLCKIDAAIASGNFEYGVFFPGSKNVTRFDEARPLSLPVPAAIMGTVVASPAPAPVQPVVTLPVPAPVVQMPNFSTFAEKWFSESEIGWRKSYHRTVRDILNLYLIPAFGEAVVGQITKEDILTFRSSLAKVRGRKKETLSNSRINYIMKIFKQIMTEAADRFHHTNPAGKIKALKVQKTDIEPFNMQQVQQIIETVQKAYRDYVLVRFFTAMRTGEADGLKWEYVDFDRRQILIRETRVMGDDEYTKTDSSQREIDMSQPVYDALKRQESITKGRSPYVFCTAKGSPIDHNNFSRRVWYPLLRYLNIKPRRPYQMRHTAATLWLAAGENPQWIARQMGHSTPKMLFEVYARFVPNLTRKDGSAFERLLTGMTGNGASHLLIADGNDENAETKEAHYG